MALECQAVVKTYLSRKNKHWW